jgi:hypothetical protein
VFFQLREGPLLLVSFTAGSNCTTRNNMMRSFSGLYAALSDDEGESFRITKPLVDENSAPRQLPTMDSKPWHMTNATAEPGGYTSARQDARGMRPTP